MGITVNINESAGTVEVNNDEERIANLESAVRDLKTAIEMIVRNMLTEKASSGAFGPLDPCDCGDPRCLKQAAYNAQQAAGECEVQVPPEMAQSGTYI
tara:strand:+ start:3592 stop:3885 length:294 start_codon:yes stop_codon:yes gene_type:complete